MQGVSGEIAGGGSPRIRGGFRADQPRTRHAPDAKPATQPAGSTSRERDSHCAFTTGRSGESSAGKVRFLRRVVPAPSHSIGSRLRAVREDDELWRVNAGQLRARHFDQHPPGPGVVQCMDGAWLVLDARRARSARTRSASVESRREVSQRRLGRSSTRLKIVVSPVRVRVSPSPKSPVNRVLLLSSASSLQGSFWARKSRNRRLRAQLSRQQRPIWTLEAVLKGAGLCRIGVRLGSRRAATDSLARAVAEGAIEALYVTMPAQGTRVPGAAKERCPVTPEVAGSSPVAPVSHTESDRVNSRTFVDAARGDVRHREPSKVRSRQENGDQNGDHWRGANARDLP